MSAEAVVGLVAVGVVVVLAIIAGVVSIWIKLTTLSERIKYLSGQVENVLSNDLHEVWEALGKLPCGDHQEQIARLNERSKEE